jgi:hypothetical protein
VSELRRLDAECVEELNVFRCVGKVVFAAYYVSDFHRYVVHYIDEMEAWVAVGSLNHKVAFFAASYVSPYKVVDYDGLCFDLLDFGSDVFVELGVAFSF